MFIQLYDRFQSYLNPIDRITEAPNEVIVEIFKNFDLSSLCHASLVCKKFNQIQNMPQMWEIQAKYFKIQLKSNIFGSYKTQLRYAELTYVNLDLFTKEIKFKKDPEDEQLPLCCKQIVSFMPANYSISMYTKSGDMLITARVDKYRNIFVKRDPQSRYGEDNPLLKRSFF